MIDPLATHARARSREGTAGRRPVASRAQRRALTTRGLWTLAAGHKWRAVLDPPFLCRGRPRPPSLLTRQTTAAATMEDGPSFPPPGKTPAEQRAEQRKEGRERERGTHDLLAAGAAAGERRARQVVEVRAQEPALVLELAPELDGAVLGADGAREELGQARVRGGGQVVLVPVPELGQAVDDGGREEGPAGGDQAVGRRVGGRVRAGGECAREGWRRGADHGAGGERLAGRGEGDAELRSEG